MQKDRSLQTEEVRLSPEETNALAEALTGELEAAVLRNAGFQEAVARAYLEGLIKKKVPMPDTMSFNHQGNDFLYWPSRKGSHGFMQATYLKMYEDRDRGKATDIDLVYTERPFVTEEVTKAKIQYVCQSQWTGMSTAEAVDGVRKVIAVLNTQKQPVPTTQNR